MAVAAIVGIVIVLAIMWIVLSISHEIAITISKKTVYAHYSNKVTYEGEQVQKTITTWQEIWKYACYTTGFVIISILFFLVCIL